MNPLQPTTDAALLRSAAGTDVYRLLAEQAGMIVYDYDLESGVIVWEGATHPLLGYTLEEFQSIDIGAWTESIHPDDRGEALRQLDEAVALARPYNCVYRFRHRDGFYLHVHDRGGFTTHDGRRRMIGSIVDVSDSRLRAQALTGLLERVVVSPGRAFFDQLTTELWRTLDATRVFVGRLNAEGDSIETMSLCDDGRIVSGEGGKVAGTLSGAVLQRGDGLMCCWGDLAERFPAFAEKYAAWGVNTYVACALIAPSGYRMGILNALFARPPARRDAVIAIMRLYAARAAAEIERRETEHTLRRLNATLEARVAERTAQLAAANAELEAFSYSVSHDLRSPLRAIDGFSRALDEDYQATLDATGRDYLRRIRQAAQRMAALIDDLIRLSRATRTQMRVDEFDLAALAREVAAELTAADTAGRHVEFRCAPVAPVRGDRALLRIVLDNLLGNAWKYTLRQPAPHVEFSIEEKPSEPTPIFTVADNGAGFDMRYAGKLFTPFQRLHTRNEFEGTGIGLATVHRIVTRHGGRVWAESAPGEGTRIHFTLKTSAL